MFVSIAAAFVGFVLTIRHRKASVQFLRAIAWRNVVFSPELYEDDAKRWKRVHIIGFIGAWISVLAAVVASFCLQALEWLE